MKLPEQRWVDIIPPFRIIKGRKYDYPKTEAEWIRECKKAIQYRRKRFEAIKSGGRIPPVNYYYTSLLVLPTRFEKQKKRLAHRAILEKKGLVRKGQHVHHVDGKYDLAHARPMSRAEHVRTHARRRAAVRATHKDGSFHSAHSLANFIGQNREWKGY